MSDTVSVSHACEVHYPISSAVNFIFTSTPTHGLPAASSQACLWQTGLKDACGDLHLRASIANGCMYAASFILQLGRGGERRGERGPKPGKPQVAPYLSDLTRLDYMRRTAMYLDE